ncbi:ABC transporter substrate-binding protein [Sorangium sp. So ce1151]|uniref:ABC transporter substrate-binding protein n=1 Tax=Sorangium sp. So ce1151 TaxID=3133332 RepID=UPI003F5E95CC
MTKLCSWRWVFCLVIAVLGAACTPSEKKTIRVAIGTQNATVNCATGGLLVRELDLLERYLPSEGPYKDVHYEIAWRDFSSGPPITAEMIAGNLDFGMMADFPAAMNGIASRRAGKPTLYIATLSGSAAGAGNGIVVPLDSPAHTVADLKGKRISVPFGSTAHGMLLRALSDVGLDPERDVTLVSQQPGEAEPALKAGTIDAHATFVPFAELFPFRGVARKIYDGATTQIPTSHGMLVRAAYAEDHPEVVVGLLRAVIEADRIVERDPERYSEVIEQVTGVDAEVAYMFHGPLGVQTRDVTLKPQVLRGLRVAADTLALLQRTNASLDVDRFADDRYLRQACEGVRREVRGAARAPREGAPHGPRRAHRGADRGAEARGAALGDRRDQGPVVREPGLGARGAPDARGRGPAAPGHVRARPAHGAEAPRRPGVVRREPGRRPRRLPVEGLRGDLGPRAARRRQAARRAQGPRRAGAAGQRPVTSPHAGAQRAMPTPATGAHESCFDRLIRARPQAPPTSSRSFENWVS